VLRTHVRDSTKECEQEYTEQVTRPQVWNKHSDKLIKAGRSSINSLSTNELKMTILKSTVIDGEIILVPDK
jgi:hypothetical protein